jgi:catechol 2,3-dioxygenase-like lactoylglutathione lyase family enzyme
MAGKKGKKKDKKAKKAEKKARKAAKKAEKRAARAAQVAAPKPAAPVVAAKAKPARKPASRPAKAASPKPAKKAAPAKRAKTVRRPKAAPPALKARQQPESLRLRSAGPSFTVNDIHKSLAFYTDVLGFTPRERWEQDGQLHGVELVAGSVSFWLGQDDWKKGHDRVKGQGFRIYCGTSQSVDAIAERIRAAGVTLAEEPTDRPWGGRDFAVVDPDGFTITIASGL